MLFNFRLRPLDRVTPWGEPEQPVLHWFGLTQGEYWIEAGEATVLEYSGEALLRFGGGRYCDYFVARLHEDLLASAPHGLEPVPPDLHPYFVALSPLRDGGDAASAFSRRLDALYDAEPDDERVWDVVDRATGWVAPRMLDCAHLTAGPLLALWSDAVETHIAWNTDDCLIEGAPVWSARSGGFSLPRETFARELTGFHDRLMAAMAERVETVSRDALAAHIEIDLDGLAQEQAARRREIEGALRPLEPPTDWKAVRDAIREIESTPA